MNETIYILKQKEKPRSKSECDVYRLFTKLGGIAQVINDSRDIVYKTTQAEVDISSSDSIIDYCKARDIDKFQRYEIGDLIYKTNKLQ